MTQNISMFNYPYIVELLSPKRPIKDQPIEHLLIDLPNAIRGLLVQGLVCLYLITPWGNLDWVHWKASA